jgi:NADH-quinone oxidoreductase subunit M
MYQRVMYGEITHEANRQLTDMNGREIALMIPIVVLMFWIGLYPSTFLRKMDESSALLLAQSKMAQTLTIDTAQHAKLPHAAGGAR